MRMKRLTQRPPRDWGDMARTEKGKEKCPMNETEKKIADLNDECDYFYGELGIALAERNQADEMVGWLLDELAKATGKTHAQIIAEHGEHWHRQHPPCPECGASGGHKEACSRLALEGVSE
jgi:hypothetical protein